jgi:hypothetical protein
MSLYNKDSLRMCSRLGPVCVYVPVLACRSTYMGLWYIVELVPQSSIVIVKNSLQGK